METSEAILSLCIGLGLSAACGFRVFVPLFIASIAAHAGHLKLSAGFDWLGSEAAMVALGVATTLEIGAYYVPWLDNLLDSVATPAAVVAGTLITASVATDMSPMLKWSLAIIAGGGSAAVVQVGTVLVRAGSTAMTGGLANPLVATAELGGSLGLSAAAVIVPVVSVLLLVGVVGVGGWAIHRRRSRGVPPALPGTAA